MKVDKYPYSVISNDSERSYPVLRADFGSPVCNSNKISHYVRNDINGYSYSVISNDSERSNSVLLADLQGAAYKSNKISHCVRNDISGICWFVSKYLTISFSSAINSTLFVALSILLFGCNNRPKAIVTQVLLSQPVIIEIINPKDTIFNFHPFTDMKGFGIENIDQWKNRLVVYAKTAIPDTLKATLLKEFPGDSIVMFQKPFYNFNRSLCADTISSKNWDNIILSANLVKDTKLQQEYLNYHATQFQKWPEVSIGFCKASFQQLLVFKTGRQLMLVISIPKGESLDKLNPLTTKDNPRVDEWNKIMAKYQEGIEGTKKGETWIKFIPPAP